MAKVQNTFLKSKMNKDLDARILPNGEYRDAQNAQISKSETSTVGNLENVLGNNSIVDITTKTGISNLVCIGNLVDEVNNTVYLFLTNNSSSNYDPNAEHCIFSYNVETSNSYVLVVGAFLNFSQKNLITGINVLEDLLFFTDDRNQPRVINTNLANTDTNNVNPTYYTTEDQISVAKYNPYQPIELYQQSQLGGENTYETTMKDVSSLFLPNGGSAKAVGAQTGVTQVTIDNIKGEINTGSGSYPAATVFKQNTFPIGSGELVDTGLTVSTITDTSGVITIDLAGGTIDVEDNQVLVFNPNPYFDNTFGGDPDYLEDKFVRFSYRYKFVDNEYSIFAPFTQIAFIPKQDGYFMKVDSPNEEKNDQQEAYQSTVVYFVENKANNITLRIPLPYTNYTIQNALKISEIDILYKESDAVAVKVVESIPIETITNSSGIASVNGTQPTPSGSIPTSSTIAIDGVQGVINSGSIVQGINIPYGTTVVDFIPTDSSSPTAGELSLSNTIPSPGLSNNSLLTFGDINYFDFEYKSTKPTKVLPESELVRVYDKVPLKALAQEVSGNRVIYGNFVNRLDPPDFLDYNVICTTKSDFNLNNINQGIVTTTGTGNKIPSGDPISCTFSQLFTPPQGLYAGMVISSPTFGTSIPPNTVVTSVSNNGQAFSTTGVVSESSTGNVIKLSSIGEAIPTGAAVSGVSGIPAATTVVNFNPTAIIDGVLTPTVTVNQAATVSANDELTFTVSNPTSTADITLSNLVQFPSGTVILVFEPGGDVLNTTSIIEYPSSSVKTNRNYQVGFVLSDRYGRQSSVILSDNKQSVSSFGLDVSGSTLYSPYIPDTITQESWPGNSLKILMNGTIDLNTYNGDVNSAAYNPLGWYSYKIVVKQTEQEYYNVYLPGIMNAYPNNTELEKGGTSHIVLINDNINKIPRDLNEVGPEQRQFGSSVQIYGRVENTANALTGSGDGNKQYYLGRNSDTVSIISTIQDLFDFKPFDVKPPNFFPQFYDLDSNPLAARITTESSIGQVASTEYFTESGKAFVANNVRIFQADATEPAPPSPEPQSYVEIASYSGDASTIAATGLAVNMLVSGANIPDRVYIGATPVFAPDTDPNTPTDTIIKIQLIDKNGNPFNFIPIENSIITFTKTIGGTPSSTNVLTEKTPGIQRLAVYETAPTESALDIYWETSSAGLISDLNAAVINNQETPGASDLFPFDTTPFNEGLAAQSNILTTGFQIVNNFGGQIILDTDNGDSINLVSVTNGYGQVVGGSQAAAGVVSGVIGRYFIFQDSAGTAGGQVGPWNIRTTDATDNQFQDFTANFFDDIFYMYDDQEELRQFTFVFDVVVNGTANQITKQVNLENVSPLYNRVQVFNDEGALTQDLGPDASPPSSVPIPPSRIFVPFRRNPQSNLIAIINAKNGAANETIPLSNKDFKFTSQNGNNPASEPQIFDQRIDDPNGPVAIVPGSNNQPIFRLAANNQVGASDIQAQLKFTPAAISSQGIKPTLYYVTVRAQDASAREDVIFEIDLRIILDGGSDGNIFNKAIRIQPITFGTFQEPAIPAILGESCGNSSLYQKDGKWTSDGCTILKVDPSVQGVSSGEIGIYLYAGGFFNDEMLAGWGAASHRGRPLPKKLRQTENIVIPSVVANPENGYVVQRQTLIGNNDFPLIKARVTSSNIISIETDINDGQLHTITINPGSVIFNTTTFKRDENNNQTITQDNFRPECMRICGNWLSNGFGSSADRLNRFNKVISYDNTTGVLKVVGNIAGINLNNSLLFYGGNREDMNPWFFERIGGVFNPADIEEAVKSVLIQWIFSAWVYDVPFRRNSNFAKLIPGVSTSDVPGFWVPLNENCCPAYHGQGNGVEGIFVECYPDDATVQATNFTWQ